ncbi:MAG: hypothetical protein QOF29_1524 [bacterium]
MAQLSLPYRIGLVSMLAILALWFTVLRPKEPAVEAPLPAAPGVTGLAGAAGAATAAAKDSAASAAATESAAKSAGSTGGAVAPSGTATAPAAPAAKAPAKAKSSVAAADRSAPLLRAIDRDRAVVLLFWNRRGIDDREVRRAVAATDRRAGKVVVKVAGVRDVARYQAITRGVQVLGSPTVLVIGPDRTAKPIVGLTTTGELDQAVGDALAADRAKK